MIRSCIKYGFREWGLSFFERNKIFSWKSRVNRGAISDDFPIRHKTITLHRHQKDFLDKLVVKKILWRRHLSRENFSGHVSEKNIFEKNFYPEKVNYVLACLLFFLDKFGLFKIGMYEDSWGELKPVSFSISSTLPRKNYLKFWKKTCRRKKKN